MQRLFVCPNCGVDTLTHEHRDGCQQQVQKQTEDKCRELGIAYEPDKYQLPLRLNPG